MGRVFPNCPGDLVSILKRVIPKNKKTVLDAALHNTQPFRNESKVKWSNPCIE